MSSITQASGKRRIMARANAGETGTATGPTPNTAKRPARGRKITSSSGAIVGLAAAAALVVGFGGGAAGTAIMRATTGGTAPNGTITNQMGAPGGANTMSYDYTGTYAAALITAAGNDANSWGQAGSNGATVTFTGRNQTLASKVSADTISSVTLNLLEGSTWTGTASITENASASSGSTTDAPITVNVDGTSTWTVTGDTTVSALNVADGDKVVDANGDTVTIKANGKTVVKGDSDVTVTVTGDYSTTLPDDATGDGTTLATDLIDRSDYDTQFGTSTTWSM